MVHGRGAALAPKTAEAVPSTYDIVWQVGEPVQPDQATGPLDNAHRLSWQSDGGGQYPRRMQIGCVRKSSEQRGVYPAREALRSVAWLQAAVRGSQPGSAILLRTRGVLSFPQLQDSPGALLSLPLALQPFRSIPCHCNDLSPSPCPQRSPVMCMAQHCNAMQKFATVVNGKI